MFSISVDRPDLFSSGPQIEANGTLTFTPATGAVGTAVATVVLKDTVANVSSASQTFRIRLVAPNLAPSFVKGPDQVVGKDSGTRTVPGWATAISAGETGQTVSFLVTHDNPGLFAVAPGVDQAGVLTYSPSPGAVGKATVTVVLRDNGGTEFGGVEASPAQTFTITVGTPNQSPSFAKGPDVMVDQDSGAKTLTGWATSISAGPTSEAGQAVSFVVTTDNPLLFSVPPRIAPNGTLTFMPEAKATGLATVTVVVKDDGGTAFGGVDTSAPQTFVITVRKPAGPALGVVSSVAFPGEAKAVVVGQGGVDGKSMFAYLALGSRGFGIAEVTDVEAPKLLGQLDLAGDAVDVAVDVGRGVVAVATTTGLHFIDVSDPTRPRRSLTHLVSATRVVAAEGVLYVAVEKDLQAYDFATGARLQTLTLPGAAIAGIAVEGRFVYALDANRLLRVIDASDPLGLAARGSVTVPAGNGRMSVAGGIAFLAAGTGSVGGMASVDVTNPDAPKVIRGVDSTAIAGDSLTLNGSGLALAVGRLAGPPVVNGLDVLNVSNPAKTGVSVARYSLPARPYGVAVARGRAFVADGTSGLQIVHYLAADSGTVAPTVALAGSFQLTTPTTATVDEGSRVWVVARTTDDAQLREVEFQIDGTKVATVTEAPFEYRFVAPALRSGRSSFALKARAIDTGGNVGISPEIQITLLPDTVAPQVLRSTPTNDAMPDEVTSVAVFFSEEIDPSTLSIGSLQLSSAGGDRKIGTADDTVVPNGALLYRPGLRSAVLTFPTRLPGNGYRLVVTPDVQDRAGNPLAGLYTADFEIESAITVANPPVTISIGPSETASGGGLVVAMPPVTVTIAAPNAGLGAIGLVVANPPVTISIAAEASGSAAGGLVVALPPVTVSIAPESAGGGASGLTVARPPVSVKIAKP
jgi:hypothetical protein